MACISFETAQFAGTGGFGITTFLRDGAKSSILMGGNNLEAQSYLPCANTGCLSVANGLEYGLVAVGMARYGERPEVYNLSFLVSLRSLAALLSSYLPSSCTRDWLLQADSAQTAAAAVRAAQVMARPALPPPHSHIRRSRSAAPWETIERMAIAAWRAVSKLAALVLRLFPSLLAALTSTRSHTTPQRRVGPSRERCA